MLETLAHWDTRLFLFLNGIHSGIFDGIMLQVSGNLVWIPLYLLMVYLLAKKFWWKSLLLVLVFIPLLVTASDQLSVLVKNLVERPRPCHTEGILEWVHLVNGHCGGKYGFVSSHASNVFALAVFSLSLLRMPWFTGGMIGWAMLVSYSRIYLGVHFPGDVLGGALLGSLIGVSVYQLFRLADRTILVRIPFFREKNRTAERKQYT